MMLRWHPIGHAGYAKHRRRIMDGPAADRDLIQTVEDQHGHALGNFTVNGVSNKSPGAWPSSLRASESLSNCLFNAFPKAALLMSKALPGLICDDK